MRSQSCRKRGHIPQAESNYVVQKALKPEPQCLDNEESTRRLKEENWPTGPVGEVTTDCLNGADARDAHMTSAQTVDATVHARPAGDLSNSAAVSHNRLASIQTRPNDADARDARLTSADDSKHRDFTIGLGFRQYVNKCLDD